MVKPPVKVCLDKPKYNAILILIKRWGLALRSSIIIVLLLREFVCLPWSEVCSARVTSLILLLLLLL